VVFGGLEGLLTQWVLDPTAMDLEKASRQLIAMVERHVTPH